MSYSLPANAQWTTDEVDYTPIQANEQPSRAWEILLMYFLLLISGNPFFTSKYDFFVVISAVIPAYYAFRNSHKRISYRTFFIFFFLLGYELMHALVYQLDYSMTIIKLTLVLLLAFSAVHLLRDRFIQVLTDTMCIIAILSFIFTFLCYVPGVNKFLYNFALDLFPMKKDFKDFVSPTLLVYTFHPQYFEGLYSYARNAGIFWESGAFAVFLNLTLYFRYIQKDIVTITDLFDKKSTLLVVAVVSTTSTMGFLALMVLLTFFTLKLKTPLKFVFLLLVLIAAYISFVSVEYLGNKVATQLEESGERNNRFGAALMDWKDIQKRPLIGSSRRIAVLFSTQQRSDDTRRPNGLTNFIRDYGLIYFSVYFYFLYVSFRQIFFSHHHYTNKSIAFFGVFLLWLMSFSELLFDLPFFKALIFLSMVYLPKYADEESEVISTHEVATV